MYVALGGVQPDDDYNEANKRHTMSHPPEHIPEIEGSPAKKAKDKKEKDEKKPKDKVCFYVYISDTLHIN